MFSQSTSLQNIDTQRMDVLREQGALDSIPNLQFANSVDVIEIEDLAQM